MNNWKQRTGYEFKQRTGESLWQESYFDHVLRDDEETNTAVKYVLENPVRKGLVTRFEEYPMPALTRTARQSFENCGKSDRAKALCHRSGSL